MFSVPHIARGGASVSSDPSTADDQSAASAAGDETSDICENCHNALDAWRSTCRHCLKWIGYPNVRAASMAAEVAQVDARYRAAWEGCPDDVDARAHLTRYEEAVASSSKAVVNRTTEAFEASLRSENDISGNFYRLIDAGLRLPQSDTWNKIRVIADDIVFPGYGEEIRFASLSLSDDGLLAYGACSMVLRSAMIESRASVFEGNTVLVLDALVADRIDLASLVEGFVGLRAVWEDRGRMAVIKSSERDLTLSFPELLMSSGATTADDDFIEVHIWGELTMQAIECVTLPATGVGRESLYLDVIRDRLDAVGVKHGDRG
jgi:hypothetical protein